MQDNKYTIINNEFNQQFEIELEGEIAYLTYRFYKKNIAFMHTVVPPTLTGKGLATALAIYAFDYARTSRKLVMVYCPFVGRFLNKNPQYLPFLDPLYLGRKN